MVKSDSKSLLVFVTVLAAIVGITGFWAEDPPSGNERFYIQNTGGVVIFEHKSHLDRVEGCSGCHHDLLSSDMNNSCGDCHDDDIVAENFEHSDLKAVEAHSCEMCHQVDDSRQAASCRSCHPSVQESDVVNIACTQCHEDGYDNSLITHGEMLEVHELDCAGCHNSRSVNTVYHEQCNRCHAIENPGFFKTGEGETRCEICHLK